jgi:hypothetical protein
VGWADARAQRRAAEAVLRRRMLVIWAMERRARRARVQARVDEEGCGAVWAALRRLRDDWD